MAPVLASESLIITLVARPDRSSVLRAVRADGSSTWQVHHGPRAMFFPFHDLTHLAVETTLGTRDGFYGLLAAGWSIVDTGGKGTRGPLPPEAVLIEQIVGLLDTERIGGGPPLTGAKLTAQLATLVATGRLQHATPLPYTQLEAVRHLRESLHAAWAATPVGEVFERAYVRPPRSSLTTRGS